MPIAVLVLALVGYGYALVVLPRARVPLLIGGVLVAIGLTLYLRQQAPPESVLEIERIAPDELTFDRLDLTQTERGATLTGRVTNGSESYRLRELTLEVRLRDCPEPDAAPETCPAIGQASAISRPDVPPGQIRAFSAHFIFANRPGVTGTLRWDWEVTALRATE